MGTRRILLSLVLLAGCNGDPERPAPPDVSDYPDNCSPLFSQRILPEYHVDISAAEWAALEDEFLNRPERQAAGLEVHPYHPIGFRYKDANLTGEPVPGVLLRLKGQSSWLQTIALDANPKMQFAIAFNEVDPKGRFMGVRKVELDMPRTDRTFLRQRVALYALRHMGIQAQCANSVRLYINGKYYGLYTNLEHVDKEFLQRNFPEADDGDLWKGGRIIKTNEETFSWDRLEIFWHGLSDIAGLEAIADLDVSVREWAAEAVLGDADGYYNGRPNYWLYDHPTRGFMWLPDDLDTAFDVDFLHYEASLVFPQCTGRDDHDREHYLLVMNDPAWFANYLAAVAEMSAKIDVAHLQAQVDRWSHQIADSVEEDKHRPFTIDDHDLSVGLLREYIGSRAKYVDSWMGCRTSGGADLDGDGVAFCNDCDDGDANAKPGATEVCNGLDDDCNGVADDVADPTTCP